MNEQIQICERTEGPNIYRVIEIKTVPVELNETEMELYAIYNGRSYKVQGKYFFQFIVID